MAFFCRARSNPLPKLCYRGGWPCPAWKPLTGKLIHPKHLKRHKLRRIMQRKESLVPRLHGSHEADEIQGEMAAYLVGRVCAPSFSRRSVRNALHPTAAELIVQCPQVILKASENAVGNSWIDTPKRAPVTQRLDGAPMVGDCTADFEVAEESVLGQVDEGHACFERVRVVSVRTGRCIEVRGGAGAPRNA